VIGRNETGVVSVNLIASGHPWDGFLTGPENELAMAAAQTMATGQYDGISPLVIYGPSGVGKSRLLASLVTEWLQHQCGSTVAHLDAQAFAKVCSEAATRPGGVGWAALRGQFRSVDLFVLEDIEGLERVPWARGELVHTLDALTTNGAAVAVSAQSPPATWVPQHWPCRLVNRLQGGLAVRIAPPALASRRRYVLRCTRQHDVTLKAEAIEALAEAADGYRTLDGWILRLALEARLKWNERDGSPGLNVPEACQALPRCALDPHTVATILADETLLTKQRLTIHIVVRGVADWFGIRLSTLRGPGRQASVVAARQIAMHLARILPGLSFGAIGNYFGGRDRASVRYACKMAMVRLNADPDLAASIALLSQGWQKADF
jgi:chromosomal replication initiator protein